jgi:hypothetical protein
MTESLTCEKCHSQKGVLFETISALPEILICHVARFGKRWFGLGKMYKMVSFPDEGMDMSHFVAEGMDCGPSVYDLVAVVSHSGTLSSGHYVCYAMSKGRWYLYDDSVVTPVSRKTVLVSQAFLLFYVKVVPERVQLVRTRLPQGVGIPIQIYSDPRMWRESIPEGDRADVFVGAEELAGGSVTRPPNDEDRKRRFVRELLTSRGSVAISSTACEQIGAFLLTKNAPVPAIFNLHEDEGIVVGEAVRMFYRDPEELEIAGQEEPEVIGEVQLPGEEMHLDDQEPDRQPEEQT